MLVEPDLRPVLDTLRNHVALDADVSDALDAFKEREKESLSVVLNEARDLVGHLAPRAHGGHPSQPDLESWLGAVLRGPHDGGWFDERVRSRLPGWSDLPPLTCVLVIGRVRHRLTEI